MSKNCKKQVIFVKILKIKILIKTITLDKMFVFFNQTNKKNIKMFDKMDKIVYNIFINIKIAYLC